MTKNNAVCNYDFTLWAKENGGNSEPVTENCLRSHLSQIAKKWCFQAEDAGSGKHYQGRISLKVKKRIGEFSLLGAHLSKTSKENMDNDFYVCKEETRIAGPWRDTDVYIPRQVREIGTLYKWQQHIEDDINKWDTRTINIVLDPKGGIGKSTLVGYLCGRRPDECRAIPPLSSMKEILGAVLCMPTARLYLCDMPKGLDKKNQQEFFSAIECIKNGHVYDTRYHYKEKWFDCPNIWVFTNVPPDESLLSRDRWKFWRVHEGILRALTL